jgi:hypothetical protein
VANLVGFNHPSKNQAESGSSKQPKKKFKKNKVNKTTSHKNAQVAKVCKFYKSPKQHQCATFREWLKNKGTDVVSFIDESFLADFPRILSGLTQVPLCTFPIHYKHSVR